MAIRRRAAAEEPQLVAVGADLVPRAGRDQHGVADADRAAIAVQLHLPAALDDVVDLFRLGVVMPLGRLLGREGRLGEALVAHRRGRQAEELADRAPVGGRERLRLRE